MSDSSTTRPGAWLLDAGVGLPPMWRGWSRLSEEWQTKTEPLPGGSYQIFDVALDDLQTAFGVAAKLDEWEDAQEDAGDNTDWCYRIGKVAWCWTAAEARMLREEMVARITQIGMDHYIRRKMEWEIAPGSLMQVFQTNDGRWVLMNPKTGAQRVIDDPALAGITDSTEVLAAAVAAVGVSP